MDIVNNKCEDSCISGDTNLTDTLYADFPSNNTFNNAVSDDTKIALLDGTFFQQIPNKSVGKRIVAVCIKCSPNYVEIKGAINCTSNFITHLKNKHGNEMLEEYRMYKKSKKSQVRSSTSCSSLTDTSNKSSSRNIQLEYTIDDSPMTLLDGTFFQELPEKSTGNNIVAICNTCAPRYVEIKGYRNCTSNFVSHLKRRHGSEILEQYRIYKKRKTLHGRPSTSSQLSCESFTVTNTHFEESFDSDVSMERSYAHSIMPFRSQENPHTFEESFFKPAVTNTYFVENFKSEMVTDVAENSGSFEHSPHTPSADTNTQFEEHFNHDIVKDVAHSMTRLRSVETPSKSLELSSKSIAYSQESFSRDILKFFAHAMIPLESVENPYFIQIFENLNIENYGLKLINHQSLGRLLTDDYITQGSAIKQELLNIKYICTTVDLWSNHNQCFFGVTIHWIEPDNLNRNSMALACQKFTRTHNNESICDLIQEIYSVYGIENYKIVATVTDNGSNLTNAFKTFNMDADHIKKEVYCIDNVNDCSDGDTRDSDTLYIDTNDQEFPTAQPSYLSCCSYILNLIASADSNKVLKGEDTHLVGIHQQVLQKCNILWNKSDQLKSVEIIQNILGHGLNKPDEIYWNNFYVSLKQISSIKEKNAKLHIALGLKNPLRDQEFQYIEEYLSCTKPIAEALDILQKESNTYYGILLPTLLALRNNLQKLTRKDFVFCKPLSEVFIESVEKRFDVFFNISSHSTQAENAIIAALCYPRFKNKWLSCFDPRHHSRLRNLFLVTVSKEFNTKAVPNDKTSNELKEDDFYNFDSDPSRSEPQSKAEDLIERFFADGNRDLNVLERYPEIKNIFLKYNTPLPSLGPVERLLSPANITTNYISDDMFEEKVVLKANLNYSERNKQTSSSNK